MLELLCLKNERLQNDIIIKSMQLLKRVKVLARVLAYGHVGRLCCYELAVQMLALGKRSFHKTLSRKLVFHKAIVLRLAN